jgi:transposase InsO family protein
VLPMEMKLRFVSLARSGRFRVSELCKEFGISRKTGHKWLGRYEAAGSAGLAEMSRSPKHSPQRTAEAVERLLVKERRKHPTWGPKKLQVVLQETLESQEIPACSTIAGILKRNGLVKVKARRSNGNRCRHSKLTEAKRVNHVWAADYKGWFYTGDFQRCDPLTVTDLYSRYIIGLNAVIQATQYWTRQAFERIFNRYGLPEIMRVDNGCPFATGGAQGLSKLSVWWITLGIEVQFTRPGHPQDNGCHERMHRTMKQESCEPASCNRRAQQQRFERWRREFNQQRPHESLGMRKPAEVYQVSARRLDGCIKYEGTRPGDKVQSVSETGHIYWNKARWHVGDAFAGVKVALRKGPKPEWPTVWFAGLELGMLADSPYRRLQPTAYATDKGKGLA